MKHLRNALRLDSECLDSLDLAVIARETGAHKAKRYFGRRAVARARLVWRRYVNLPTAA